MVTLYIISTTPYAGKTALCVALGRRFRKDGYRIGYMRPVTTTKARIGECMVDEEAELMRQTLSLEDPVYSIWPVCLDPATVEAVLHGEGEDYMKMITDAFAQVSKDKDIVLLESGSRCSQGMGVGLSCDRVADELGAKALLVAKYDVSTVVVIDDLLADKQRLGDKVLGVVLNAVDRDRVDYVRELVVPFLEKNGLPVLAVLPADRVLNSVTVSQLVDDLQGEVICRPDLGNELVENLMIGAMSVDASLSYFRRSLNKAVITGGDRPDIQLAALETSTKCLVLTGNFHPNPLIINRAEEAGVPIILVKHDTMATVQLVQDSFRKIRFHHPKRIDRFERIVGERFDFAALYQALGLQK